MRAGVIGAGIMGRLLALKLIQAGWRVTLFDQQNQAADDSCSMAAAGLLTPFTELNKSNTLLMHFAKESVNQYWPDIISLLKDNIFFARKGSLVIAPHQNREELAHFIRLIEQKIPGQKPYQHLSEMEIKTLEPELNKFSEAYFFPDEAHIDSQALMISLANYLKSKLDWQVKTVDSIAPNQITIEKQNYFFDMVCDCRGLGAKSYFQGLRGVRGELIWVHAPEVNLNCLIRLLNPHYSLYLVPRPNHIYILGATEIETEHRKAITVRSTLEILSAAYYLHTGFAEAEVIKTVENCRPTLPGNLPVIKYQNGLVAINGLYRHGFSIAPILANEVMLWLQSDIANVCYPQLWEYTHENISQ